MIRAIMLGGVAVLTVVFAWPPDYAEQSRSDVATCVGYARQSSPSFDAQVRGVDLTTGRVDIERSASDARGEVAFSKCLLAMRHWRLIERNLPSATEPGPADSAPTAEKAPPRFIR
jgi:hypothetical protein